MRDKLINTEKIMFYDREGIPGIPQEDLIIPIPSITVIYSLSFDELSTIITKEVKLYDGLELTRIPHKNDTITFGDELDCDCGFIVESVSRSQDKNEIFVVGKHWGHDCGLVCDRMVNEHGFE